MLKSSNAPSTAIREKRELWTPQRSPSSITSMPSVPGIGRTPNRVFLPAGMLPLLWRRDPELRLFFGDRWGIKQYCIDNDAIERGAREIHDMHLEAAAREKGFEDYYTYSKDEPASGVPEWRRYGRVPVLAFCDGWLSEESVNEDMLKRPDPYWLDNLCAFIASFLIDSSGTAYFPDCLLRPSSMFDPGVWVPPSQWRTARTPSSFWVPVLIDGPGACEDDERGHFCFPKALPQIEHNWSKSPFGSSVRAWSESRYSIRQARMPHWVIKYGTKPESAFIDRQALEALQDDAGTAVDRSEPYFTSEIWIDPFESSVSPLRVNEFYGFTALAAFDLLNDARSGRLPTMCPECGRVMVLGARQHRDRLCVTCASERRRATWRRSKQKTGRPAAPSIR
jgi:hypothetical protein